MDLIFMKPNREDEGVLHAYTFDLAFGKDENDFECKIAENNHCCDEDFILYIENTEYGGIIDSIGADTAAKDVTYYGRTWHGVLNSKVLEPDSGANYLVLSGEANSVLATLINRMGLNSLFKASDEVSGINISNYQMNRYIKGYDGIRKMLKAFGAKLNMVFSEGFVVLSAKPIIDYSRDEQFDKDQIDFVVKKNNNVLNHVIGLGQGELSEREVIHVYADASGNISETQVFTGLEEVTDTYDNNSAESSEELYKGCVEMLETAWHSDELDFSFNSDDECFDIDDIVGATESVTGIEIRAEITKKIVQMNDNTTTISYEVGERI